MSITCHGRAHAQLPYGNLGVQCFNTFTLTCECGFGLATRFGLRCTCALSLHGACLRLDHALVVAFSVCALRNQRRPCAAHARGVCCILHLL